MLSRRGLLFGLFSAAAVVVAAPTVEAAERGFSLFGRRRRKSTKSVAVKRRKKPKVATRAKRTPKARKPSYAGATIVDYASAEPSGTIIVSTSERALYQVLGNGKAKRYLVAVGKEGFSWSGTARVGSKAKNPRWTPPPEMIRRTPKYARWRRGMPGGIPANPLGARALYLFNGKSDTGFRIHGTNAPSSIGTAASSGCIRMLNEEVVELYEATRIGTKVIVL